MTSTPVDGGIVEVRIVRWSGDQLPTLVAVHGSIAEVIAKLLVTIDLNSRERIRDRVQDFPTSAFRMTLDHRNPALADHVLIDPVAARGVLRMIEDAEQDGQAQITW